MTAEANGYSVMSVRRIVCEGKKRSDLSLNSTVITLDKKRKTMTKLKALVDDF